MSQCSYCFSLMWCRSDVCDQCDQHNDVWSWQVFIFHWPAIVKSKFFVFPLQVSKSYYVTFEWRNNTRFRLRVLIKSIVCLASFAWIWPLVCAVCCCSYHTASGPTEQKLVCLCVCVQLSLWLTSELTRNSSSLCHFPPVSLLSFRLCKCMKHINKHNRTKERWSLNLQRPGWICV